jgi:uncharacterized protein YjhX (UPF0386 family)
MYVGMNMIITPSPNELCTIKDQQTRIVSSGFVRCSTRDGVPDIGVCYDIYAHTLPEKRLVPCYIPGDIDPRCVSRILASAKLTSR